MSCATFSRSIFFGPSSLASFLTIGNTSDGDGRADKFVSSAALQRAQPLRRIPLDRGRSEFEARRRCLFLHARAASAASARGGFPPRRAAPESRSHLGEPGRSRSVLEAFEPAIQ